MNHNRKFSLSVAVLVLFSCLLFLSSSRPLEASPSLPTVIPVEKLLAAAELQGILDGALTALMGLIEGGIEIEVDSATTNGILILTKNEPPPSHEFHFFLRRAWNCLLNRGKILRTPAGYPALLTDERTEAVMKALKDGQEQVSTGDYIEALITITKARQCCQEGYEDMFDRLIYRTGGPLNKALQRGYYAGMTRSKLLPANHPGYARVKKILGVMCQAYVIDTQMFDLMLFDYPEATANLDPNSLTLRISNRLLKSMDDSQLAFCLGHQLGHVLGKDSVDLQPQEKGYWQRSMAVLRNFWNSMKNKILTPVRRKMGRSPIDFVEEGKTRANIAQFQAQEKAADNQGMDFLAMTDYRDEAGIEALNKLAALPKCNDREREWDLSRSQEYKAAQQPTLSQRLTNYRDMLPYMQATGIVTKKILEVGKK